VPDTKFFLTLLGIALCGAILYFVAREIWRGILEAKKEFDAKDRKARHDEPEQESSFNPGSEPDPEPTAEDASATAGQRNAPRSWYQVLGVPPTASILDIKTAYRLRISLYHPDRVAGLGEELQQLAEKKAKEINEAYALACRLRG
jgi:DnaJ-domain-containing protein 1